MGILTSSLASLESTILDQPSTSNEHQQHQITSMAG
jgi:hypothetical protein